jgi:membrane fusion protein (multidrug efflux system)
MISIKAVVLAVGIAASVAALSGCSKGAANDAKGGGERPVTVTLGVATVRDWNLTARAVGSLDADERVTLRNEVAGVVREIAAREGSLVRAGELLLQFDDEKLRLEVARAEAKYDEARANLMRRKPLFEQKIISEAELIEAQSNFKSAQAELGLAKRRLADARVVAPFDGELGRSYVAVGDYAAVGTPLFELVKLDKLKLHFHLPEKYLPRARVGQPVRVRAPAYPEKTFQGVVDFVDPIVDAATRTVRLRALVDNPEGLLRPNLFVNVEVNVGVLKDALVVGEEAILSNVGGFMVYVVDAQGRAQARNVRLGEREPGFVQILEGLKPNEKIVLQGHALLRHGAKVVERPPAATQKRN